MRSLGVLDCKDCGERHEIHVNSAGHLVALIACRPSRTRGLPAMARQRLQQSLVDARKRLSAAGESFGAGEIDCRELAEQLDEVVRQVVRAQNTIDHHAPQT